MKSKTILIALLLITATSIACWRIGYSISLSDGDTAIIGEAATSGTAGSSGDMAMVATSVSADVSAQSGVGVSSTDATTTISGAGDPVTINPPGVDDQVSLVADLSTGKPYLSVNADERWPLASISKLMTAVVATDLLSPDADVTITPTMTAADPTEHILNVGDTYTVSDLLRVMLLPSNNVAAEALAQYYGRAQFLAAMNAKAQAWGMTSTYYDDPSGLSAANESTAEDLLKLAQNIYVEYPQILAITRMPQATVQNLATGKPVTVKSINDFAGSDDFIGGKTGYTDQADGNLLSIFEYNNQPVFIVVLGIADGVRFDATQSLFTWLKAHLEIS